MSTALALSVMTVLRILLPLALMIIVGSLLERRGKVELS
jgi:hypothetical protein